MQTFQSLQIYVYVQAHYIYLILCLDGHLCQMTQEQSYQIFHILLPMTLLSVKLRRRLILQTRSRRKDQESEVCQDDLDLLTAAFGDSFSFFRMQAQVHQHYPPSSVWLAARNMRGHLGVHFKEKNSKINLQCCVFLSMSPQPPEYK